MINEQEALNIGRFGALKAALVVEQL